MQIKRLNLKMDVIFFAVRKSEQNENADIAMKIYRLSEYEQRIIITQFRKE